jgi:hypothetical protein
MIPFDFAPRLLSSVDGLLRALLPGWASLLVWGALAGFISTALYRLLSPRERIRDATVRACELRAAMLAYSGDFEGLLSLIKCSLVAALYQLRLVLGPAVAASLPGLIVIAYVSGAYVVSGTVPTAAFVGAHWLRSCEGAFFASASIFSALANAIFRTR